MTKQSRHCIISMGKSQTVSNFVTVSNNWPINFSNNFGLTTPDAIYRILQGGKVLRLQNYILIRWKTFAVGQWSCMAKAYRASYFTGKFRGTN